MKKRKAEQITLPSFKGLKKHSRDDEDEGRGGPKMPAFGAASVFAATACS